MTAAMNAGQTPVTFEAAQIENSVIEWRVVVSFLGPISGHVTGNCRNRQACLKNKNDPRCSLGCLVLASTMILISNHQLVGSARTAGTTV